MEYSTLIFDCDGVVLDSNGIKTEAFRQAALPYGHDKAQALVAYHVENGGVSRYYKFQHFLTSMLPREARGPDLDELLVRFARAVYDGLLTCKSAPGLADLREVTQEARWLIASGGDQRELRHAFDERGIADMFDGGIFGSPDTKEEILSRELAAGNIRMPALFLGDSKYDYRVATQAGMDFMFVSNWTEVADWRQFTQDEGIKTVADLHELKEVLITRA